MNWSFLDILDEIMFSKPVQDRFKRHFRILAHPSAFSLAVGLLVFGLLETKAIAPEFALPAKNLIVDAVRRGHGRRAEWSAVGASSVEGHSWTNGRPAGCAFRRTRAGNAWRGAFAVTFQGVTAKRGFSVE